MKIWKMTIEAMVKLKKKGMECETLSPVLYPNIALQTASQRKSKNQKRAQTTKKEQLSSGLSPAAL